MDSHHTFYSTDSIIPMSHQHLAATPLDHRPNLLFSHGFHLFHCRPLTRSVYTVQLNELFALLLLPWRILYSLRMIPNSSQGVLYGPLGGYGLLNIHSKSLFKYDLRFHLKRFHSPVPPTKNSWCLFPNTHPSSASTSQHSGADHRSFCSAE